MKRILTAVLIASLMALPFRSYAPEPEPEPAARVIGGFVLVLVVVAVSTVVIVGLKKMADKIPPPGSFTNQVSKAESFSKLILRDAEMAPPPTNAITLQWTPALNRPWADALTFEISQDCEMRVLNDGLLVATVPPSTFVQGSVTNVVYDLRAYPLPGPPEAYFRMKNEQ